MKALFAVLILLSLSHAEAVPKSTLDKDRLNLAKSYVLAQVNLEGSKLNRWAKKILDDSVSGAQKFTTGSVSAIEVGSTICGYKGVDSQEDRSFLVSLKYLAGQRSIFDNEGAYKANVAMFGSIQFNCDMSARRYASANVQWHCEPK